MMDDDSQDMRELLYSNYKSNRELIGKLWDTKMTYNEFLFIQDLKTMCDCFDKHDREFLNRWLSEHENL